jgi:hypothetical protein
MNTGGFASISTKNGIDSYEGRTKTNLEVRRMKMSYFEKLALKSALKEETPFGKAVFITAVILCAVFSILFFSLFLVRKENILFANSFISGFTACFGMVIRTYQGLIKKLEERQR